jgi:hypothetical protein
MLILTKAERERNIPDGKFVYHFRILEKEQEMVFF